SSEGRCTSPGMNCACIPTEHHVPERPRRTAQIGRHIPRGRTLQVWSPFLSPCSAFASPGGWVISVGTRLAATGEVGTQAAFGSVRHAFGTAAPNAKTLFFP